MSNIENHRAFIESLEGEKGLPEEMHGLRFDAPLSEFSLNFLSKNHAAAFMRYLIERCRRAESRQIPDLKEKVKAFGRDAIDAADYAFESGNFEEAHAFRYLCAEVKP